MSTNSLYEQRKKFVRHKQNLKILSGFKKLALSLAVSAGLVVGFAAPTFAIGGANNASPCGSIHGAFNYQNSVYGSYLGPGNGSKGDSSEFGVSGGTPGADGAVGQQAGATGYRNSHTQCQ